MFVWIEVGASHAALEIPTPFPPLRLNQLRVRARVGVNPTLFPYVLGLVMYYARDVLRLCARVELGVSNLMEFVVNTESNPRRAGPRDPLVSPCPCLPSHGSCPTPAPCAVCRLQVSAKRHSVEIVTVMMNQR